jgi:hypothetical protein
MLICNKMESNIYHIVTIRNTEVVICILLVILKRADGLNHDGP